MEWLRRHRILRSTTSGYAAAIALSVAATFAASWLRVPAFVFEHFAVLLVVAIAVPWGLGPAGAAALVSVSADNLLLREPIGSPTITGARDVIDLVLFVVIALIVSGLVTRAHTAREIALQSADRERRAREDRDRLIATVTHDLATPLAVLSGTVEFAKRRGADGDITRLLDRLETASARATSLVRLLSDAQALESGGLNLRIATHDLRTLVQPIAAMMDRFSERHPVLLTLPDDAVPIDGDADRLQRVLENLVNNAIKYSPDGGPVEISVTTEGRDAVIEVRDHGIGISPDALPRIFEHAYRAPEAAAHAPGLGLGLSIASQLVARHRGTIGAVEAEGGGTIVSVRLPLAPPINPAAASDLDEHGVTVEPSWGARR